MALPSEDVEMDTTETGSQHKGKGGIRLEGTTEHFETKYQEAADAESQVRQALAIDDDVDMAARPGTPNPAAPGTVPSPGRVLRNCGHHARPSYGLSQLRVHRFWARNV